MFISGFSLPRIGTIDIININMCIMKSFRIFDIIFFDENNLLHIKYLNNDLCMSTLITLNSDIYAKKIFNIGIMMRNTFRKDS